MHICVYIYENLFHYKSILIIYFISALFTIYPLFSNYLHFLEYSLHYIIFKARRNILAKAHQNQVLSSSKQLICIKIHRGNSQTITFFKVSQLQFVFIFFR